MVDPSFSFFTPVHFTEFGRESNIFSSPFTFAVLFPVEKQACGPEVSPKAGLSGRARPEIQFIFRLLGEK
jgi:hypothetical protein